MNKETIAAGIGTEHEWVVGGVGCFFCNGETAPVIL